MVRSCRLLMAVAGLTAAGAAPANAQQPPPCSADTPPAMTIVELAGRVPYDVQEPFALDTDPTTDATVRDARLVMRDAASGAAFFDEAVSPDDLNEFFIELDAGDPPAEVVLGYVEETYDDELAATVACRRVLVRTVRGYRRIVRARALTVDRALSELERLARRAGQGSFVEYGEWEGSCKRITRRRKRCRAGGFLGDGVYALRGTVWLTGKGNRERIHFSLVGRQIDEYCVHVTKTGDCIRTRRFRGSRRT